MPDPATAGKTLRMEARTEGPCRVLKAGGQLTETECGEFLEALRNELRGDSRRLILDVDGLLYLSSAGLGALVSAHQSFVNAGRRLVLAGVNPKVRKLLALTSLDRLIECADTLDEALKRP